MKTPLSQKQVKDLVAGTAKIEIMPLAKLLTTNLATRKAKKTGKDSETPNSKLSSPKKSVKKKKKEPSVLHWSPRKQKNP